MIASIPRLMLKVEIGVLISGEQNLGTSELVLDGVTPWYSCYEKCIISTYWAVIHNPFKLAIV
ncbi:hypothetical protein [Helicobacter salomonis]|uniref:hypothetical protein n=1 Tax=Helicobacter salomonis TaxID=56878 RepID=UPI0013151997|nr:hypothetical protein [Helicobacter salomonis]